MLVHIYAAPYTDLPHSYPHIRTKRVSSSSAAALVAPVVLEVGATYSHTYRSRHVGIGSWTFSISSRAFSSGNPGQEADASRTTRALAARARASMRCCDILYSTDYGSSDFLENCRNRLSLVRDHNGTVDFYSSQRLYFVWRCLFNTDLVFLSSRIIGVSVTR